MSESSRHEASVSGARPAERHRIETWLAAEARQDVPTAEAALRAVFDQRPPRGSSILADRVMVAARAEGALPERAWGRFVLAAVAISTWVAMIAGIGMAAGLVLPGSPLLVSGMARAVDTLADGVRVVHFGWDLVRGLQQALLTMLAAPEVTMMIVVAMAAGIASWFWLGRLLAADASDASTGRFETA